MVVESRGRVNLPIAIGAMAFIVVSLGAFSTGIWEVIQAGQYTLADNTTAGFLKYWFPVILLLVTAFLCALLGVRLLSSAGATDKFVIPANDFQVVSELLSSGKTDGITDYIRLSSLTGFTGTFTQLGLTGLPLATIFMTLFFCALTVFTDADLSKSFLDLAKLTLGAFIGSFVQRSAERQRQAEAEARAKAQP